MLLQACLNKSFWAEAITYASHLVNPLPSATMDGKTPIEVWFGKPAVNYDNLRIFGCPVYFHVTENKLDARAKRDIFIGFKSGVKGLWCLELKKVVISKDITFNEMSMLKEKKGECGSQRSW